MIYDNGIYREETEKEKYEREAVQAEMQNNTVLTMEQRLSQAETNISNLQQAAINV